MKKPQHMITSKLSGKVYFPTSAEKEDRNIFMNVSERFGRNSQISDINMWPPLLLFLDFKDVPRAGKQK